MTTAHRPTWNPARGGEAQGGFRVIAPTAKYSSRDMPAELKMKLRQVGQAAPKEVSRRDLKAELEAREQEHLKKTGRLLDENEAEAVEDEVQPPVAAIAFQSVDADVELEDDLFGSDREKPEDEKSEEDDDSDSDDDNAELMRELERIKKEREEEKLKKEAEEREFEERQRAEATMRGNPLLAAKDDEASSKREFRVKRRWDDDVVFRNQSRGEKVAKPRFINDTIRNDFHRRFLEKYIR